MSAKFDIAGIDAGASAINARIYGFQQAHEFTAQTQAVPVSSKLPPARQRICLLLPGRFFGME
jgi:hypothetical protein